jgi:hypothetical protein
MKFPFRAEAFNVFNHPSANTPNAVIGHGSSAVAQPTFRDFGTVTSVYTKRRPRSLAHWEVDLLTSEEASCSGEEPGDSLTVARHPTLSRRRRSLSQPPYWMVCVRAEQAAENSSFLKGTAFRPYITALEQMRL